MTIKVSVKNEDSRETAIVAVSAISVATGEVDSSVPDKQLKGGESCEVYVHSGQKIVVEEIRNG